MLPIGENIRKLRIERAITQEQLAERLHITSQAVSKWENQTTQPDIGLLAEIAAYFGVTIDELFKTNMRAYPNAAARLVAIYETDRTEENFRRAMDALGKMAARGEMAPRHEMLSAYLYRLRALEYERIAEDGLRKAIGMLESARASEYDFYAAHKQLIKLLAHTGRSMESIETYRKQIEREPDVKEWYVLMQIACEMAGELELERETIASGRARFPDDPELMLCEAAALQADERYEEAIAMAERAFVADPEMAPCMFLHLECLTKLGRTGDACDQWRRIADWLWARGFDVDARWAEGEMRKLRNA